MLEDVILGDMWAYWALAYLAFLVGLGAKRILDWLESHERKIVVAAMLDELELASQAEIEALRMK